MAEIVNVAVTVCAVLTGSCAATARGTASSAIKAVATMVVLIAPPWLLEALTDSSSCIFGQSRPRVSAALLSLRPSEAKPLSVLGGASLDVYQTAGPLVRLEPERQATGEVPLVRILRVADNVASPVGIAPPAGRVRLDVSGCPLDADARADVRAREELYPGAPRRRKLRFAPGRSRDTARRGEVHVAEVRGPESDHRVRTRVRIVLAEVVGEVAVIGVDGHVAHVFRGLPAHGQLRQLLSEQESDLDVLAGVDADIEPPLERILRIDSIIDIPIARQDGAPADAVGECPSHQNACLDLLVLGQGRCGGDAGRNCHGGQNSLPHRNSFECLDPDDGSRPTPSGFFAHGMPPSRATAESTQTYESEEFPRMDAAEATGWNLHYSEVPPEKQQLPARRRCAGVTGMNGSRIPDER